MSCLQVTLAVFPMKNHSSSNAYKGPSVRVSETDSLSPVSSRTPRFVTCSTKETSYPTPQCSLSLHWLFIPSDVEQGGDVTALIRRILGCDGLSIFGNTIIESSTRTLFALGPV